MSDTNKHTPAPWVVDHNYLGDNDGYRDIHIGDVNIKWAMSKEDANLIAAAPELLRDGDRLYNAVVSFFEAMNSGSHEPDLSRKLNRALDYWFHTQKKARGDTNNDEGQ